MLRLNVVPLLLLWPTTFWQEGIPPEPQLTTKAKRVCSTTGWSYPPYVWSGDRTIISFHGDATTGEVKSASFLDVKTGKVAPFVLFNKAWKLPGKMVISPRVSPDGRWLYFARKNINTNGTLDGWTVAGLNKSSTWTNFVFDVNNFMNAVWSLDSQRLIDIDQSYGGRLFSRVISSPEHVVEVSLLPEVKPPKNSFYFGLGTTRQGDLIAQVYDSPHRSPLRILKASPDRRDSQQLTAVEAPLCLFVEEIALSPDGTSLVWNLGTYASPVSDSSDQAYSKRYGASEIWISKLDGTDKRRLGWLLVQPYKTSAGPENLAWSPNGSSISFTYKGSLWIVPAQ